jgi:hypothetical protein
VTFADHTLVFEKPDGIAWLEPGPAEGPNQVARGAEGQEHAVSDAVIRTNAVIVRSRMV